MFDTKVILEYRKQFANSQCYILASEGALVVVAESGERYVAPDNETKESFMDRLKRSKELGENLFYKEWIRFDVPKGAWL